MGVLQQYTTLYVFILDVNEDLLLPLEEEYLLQKLSESTLVMSSSHAWQCMSTLLCILKRQWLAS